jgi:hypothetical protein
LPGNSGNGGRPKGSRNKLGELFVSHLYADWQAHGEAVIARVRDEEPAVYLRVVAGLLPKRVELDPAPLSEISDDDLTAAIVAIRAARAVGADAGEDGG